MSRIGTAGLALSLVPTMALMMPAAPTAYAQESGSWLAMLLERTTTGARTYDHLQAWQRIADDNGGNRATGTPGDVQSADYLVRRLQRAGLQVTRQPVPYEDHHVDAERIEELDPDAKPIRTMLARWSPSTPAEGLETHVVAVPTDSGGEPDPTPGCEPGDYAGLPVTGSVVVAPRGGCTLVEQQRVSAALGAKAHLAYLITPRPDNLTRFHIFFPDQVSIPVASITQRSAEELADAAARDGVRLRVDLRAHRVSGVTENILAETSGGRSDRVVMAGAHLDSVAEAPGINDNATSAGALLETAIRIAPFQSIVQNKVRFAWWGAEELIVVGSSYYVGRLDPDELARIALYLNYEMIASPNFGRFVMDGDDSDHPGTGQGPGPPGSGAVEKVIADYYASRGSAYETSDLSDIGSDHEPFNRAGVPIGGFFEGADETKTPEQAARYGGTAGDMYDPCYHQACDTVDNIDRTELDRNVRAIAWTIGRFAADESLVPPTSRRRLSR